MKKERDRAEVERYSQEYARCLAIVARQVRKEKGLTQHKVAKRAEVSLRWVQRLEANQLAGNYSLGKLYQVACALGVGLYELYRRAEEMTGPPPWLRKQSTPPKLRKDR
jgi:transcriptional regulator with XRE-family HTH domain